MPRLIFIRRSEFPAYSVSPNQPNPYEGSTVYMVNGEECKFIDDANNIVEPDWPEGGGPPSGGGPDNDY